MASAEAAMISEEAVRRELWVSFCSLIRAYVAAAQSGSDMEQVLVLQEQPGELELVSGARVLRMVLDASEEIGYWVLHQGLSADTVLAEGAFRIGMDSLVEWSGLPGRRAMDAVAEAIATLISE